MLMELIMQSVIMNGLISPPKNGSENIESLIYYSDAILTHKKYKVQS